MKRATIALAKGAAPVKRATVALVKGAAPVKRATIAKVVPLSPRALGGVEARARGERVGVRGATVLLGLLLCAWSPFMREHPAVKEGNEHLLSGDAAAALERYDTAEREVGPKPEVDYDRGNALYAAGRSAEAREAWARAVERGAAPRLASRALQNTGNALDAAGDRAGAIAALAEALAQDPENGDARYDLEVLLRREAEDEQRAGGPPKDESGGAGGGGQSSGKPTPGDGPKPDRGAPSGADGQAEAAPKPEPREGGAPQEAPRPEGEREEASAPLPADAGADPGRPRNGEVEGRAPLTRHEAEALLDALRSRERNMPMASPRERRTRRTDAERDW